MLDPTEMPDQPETPEPTSGPDAQSGAPAVADEAPPPAAAPDADPQPVYTRAQFLAAAGAMGLRPWDIAAGLHQLGRDTATRDELLAAVTQANQRSI